MRLAVAIKFAVGIAVVTKCDMTSEAEGPEGAGEEASGGVASTPV